ncbi:MAG TPA: Ku protein, partial [Kofleriaceae bacterium]|nr:Ku protein [Kofleriaceae bacterium]
RAYQLFRDALEDSELVAIAAYAARGKQYIVLLRPYETGLAMHQLRYPDEVKPWSEVPAVKHTKAAAAELALARQVIDSLRHATYDPSRYKDEVKARVRALIASKAKGGEITAPPTVERAPVTDLMAALKASLGAGNGKSNGAARRSGKSNGAPRRAAGKSNGKRAGRQTGTREPAARNGDGAATRSAHAAPRAHRASSGRSRASARSHASRPSAAAHRARAHR